MCIPDFDHEDVEVCQAELAAFWRITNPPYLDSGTDFPKSIQIAVRYIPPAGPYRTLIMWICNPPCDIGSY